MIDQDTKMWWPYFTAARLMTYMKKSKLLLLQLKPIVFLILLLLMDFYSGEERKINTTLS